MAPPALDVVARHLATVAVDGAGTEMAGSLTRGFRLHVDDLTTDRDGYLALVAARWATEGERPPLEVTANAPVGNVVTVAIAPRCVGHFRVEDDAIAEAWITTDWNHWLHPLQVDGVI